MSFIVDIQQMARIDMSVLLGRREAGVAQKLLDRSQVCSPLQEMGGEAVAERVRTDPPGDRHGSNAMADEEAY